MDNNVVRKRHEAALDNLHVVGQYLIIQADCPQYVREAWKTINEYIRNKKDNPHN